MTQAAPRAHEELWNISVIALTAALAVGTGRFAPVAETPADPPSSAGRVEIDYGADGSIEEIVEVLVDDVPAL